MSYPPELRYTEDHEWILVENDIVTVGITWHAQESLGDIVFAQLPEVGELFEAGDVCAELESVKAVSDVYAPVAGAITEVNEELDGAEESINQDPYGDGWMFRIRITEASALDELLDSNAYQKLIGDEENAS